MPNWSALMFTNDKIFKQTALNCNSKEVESKNSTSNFVPTRRWMSMKMIKTLNLLSSAMVQPEKFFYSTVSILGLRNLMEFVKKRW